MREVLGHTDWVRHSDACDSRWDTSGRGGKAEVRGHREPVWRSPLLESEKRAGRPFPVLTLGPLSCQSGHHVHVVTEVTKPRLPPRATDTRSIRSGPQGGTPRWSSRPTAGPAGVDSSSTFQGWRPHTQERGGSGSHVLPAPSSRRNWRPTTPADTPTRANSDGHTRSGGGSLVGVATP